MLNTLVWSSDVAHNPAMEAPIAKRKTAKRVIFYGDQRISNIRDIPVLEVCKDPAYCGTMFAIINGVVTEVCVHNGKPLYG